MGPHDYSSITKKLSLFSLADGRQFAINTFLLKLFDGLIDSPTQISIVNLYVPPHPSRYRYVFSIPFSGTNHLYNEPFTRVM